jgi:hypothetical protein
VKDDSDELDDFDQMIYMKKGDKKKMANSSSNDFPKATGLQPSFPALTGQVIAKVRTFIIIFSHLIFLINQRKKKINKRTLDLVAILEITILVRWMTKNLPLIYYITLQYQLNMITVDMTFL